MERITLLDIVKLNKNDKIIGLVEEVISVVPELDIIPGKPRKGKHFETLVRTRVPKVKFRRVNDGSDPVKSGYENRMFQCHLIDGRMEVDKAAADIADEGPDFVKAAEAVGYFIGQGQTLASQVWYGPKSDPLGFPGACQLVAKDMGTWLGNKSEGISANTGTSVFAINANVLRGLSFFFGGEGMGLLGQDMTWREETILGENGKPLDGYVCSLPFWPGLALANSKMVVRYDNIAPQEGKSLNDDIMDEIFHQFTKNTGGIPPTHYFMSFEARRMLQKSRAATLVGTGTTRPDQPKTVPVPKDHDGIPIVASSAIVDTESITART